MRRFIWISGLVIGTAIGLVLTVFAAQTPSPRVMPGPTTSPRAVPARLAPVARGLVAHPIRATGQIRAKSQIDLAFLVGGEVTWVGVDVGTKVRRGQVLARVDETQIAADAERAHAAVAQ